MLLTVSPYLPLIYCTTVMANLKIYSKFWQISYSEVMPQIYRIQELPRRYLAVFYKHKLYFKHILHIRLCYISVPNF